MGILTIESEKFLVYVKNVYPQTVLPKNIAIYQIADIDYIPFVKPVVHQIQQIM